MFLLFYSDTSFTPAFLRIESLTYLYISMYNADAFDYFVSLLEVEIFRRIFLNEQMWSKKINFFTIRKI